MRPSTLFVFSCTGLALVGPALADTLRCGSVLIEPGDDAGYVLRNCGEPDSAPAVAGPIPDEDAALDALAAPFRADRWRYDRGSGKFPVVVVIGDDGRVAAIHFEKQRG